MAQQRYKLIFYTPLPPCETIKSAIFATGAGTFPGGKYSHCAFESLGTGQFLPVEGSGANPNIGEVGKVERVEEKRVEIMCVGEEVVRRAVEALKREHPYEEVAYEVYKMEDF
ncbi:structural toxin protein RtxA [Ascobolus immersus RN42]|uniref:ATP phosphoribosyltransferase n=1 Tax=Ascobolus immersus RN42 TaxID=1160509 RepID=A0A3N4I216_ASCIM|nr:structural toxin protein RtxA [Ascobolus immersus RN42]